jgi:hypothetical protein
LADPDWIAHIQGKREEALRTLRAAAEQEDAIERDPVPARIISALELRRCYRGGLSSTHFDGTSVPVEEAFTMGNTHAPCVIIGERLAEILKG